MHDLAEQKSDETGSHRGAVWVKWDTAVLLLVAILATACRTETSVPQANEFSGNEVKPGLATGHPADTVAHWWVPEPGTSWQWQLDGEVDTSFEVDMYDLDLFGTDAGMVRWLKEQGRAVICYINVGSWEDWRPDAALFPEEVIGKSYAGWPGERWLDIRRIDLLTPVIGARLDECASKGFDGVEPDNIDAFTNNTGFNLTYEDQLKYNRWLAEEAHRRGLSIGLKNDAEQAIDLLPYFDWALTEECFFGNWCEELEPFIESGKAVFAAEYVESGITLADICVPAEHLKFSLILKHLDLNAYRSSCD